MAPLATLNQYYNLFDTSGSPLTALLEAPLLVLYSSARVPEHIATVVEATQNSFSARVDSGYFQTCLLLLHERHGSCGECTRRPKWSETQDEACNDALSNLKKAALICAFASPSPDEGVSSAKGREGSFEQ